MTSQIQNNICVNKKNRPRGVKTLEPIVIVTMGFVIIYFSLFMIFPIAYAFVGSFFNWQPMSGIFKFIGFANYKKVLIDTLFWSSMGRTIYFAGVVVFFRTVLGLILATLIYSVSKYKSFFRTTYFLPVVTSVVAVSLLWKYFYDPSLGLFNSVLASLNLPEQSWLKSTTLVLPCIMLMVIWKDVGYAIVLYIAGLSGIPSSFYEAGIIDGANKLQTFRYITVPLLKPTTLFVVVTSLISYLQVFTQIFIMTTQAQGGGGGGPGTSSNTIVYLLYEKAFRQYQFGEASALAFLLFLVIMLITLIQMKCNKTDWGY